MIFLNDNYTIEKNGKKQNLKNKQQNTIILNQNNRYFIHFMQYRKFNIPILLNSGTIICEKCIFILFKLHIKILNTFKYLIFKKKIIILLFIIKEQVIAFNYSQTWSV